ncbi:MAG: quinone-dependent dihydroorotate dehydrogenase [Patescibacteria group bacterium]
MKTYNLIKPLIFRLTAKDAEIAHHWGIRYLEAVSKINWLSGRIAQRHCVYDRRLEQTFHGVTFPNPVGLAAGFSKNGEALAGITAYGFGFIEVGTVPFLAQPGNPRPRLFRLPSEQSLINRMGFNSQGAPAVSDRLSQLETNQTEWPVIPIGINLGKSKSVDDSDINAVVADYLSAQRLLQRYADYLVVNVSSPNTPGLRSYQEPKKLSVLLNAVREESMVLADKAGRPVPPLFVKFTFDIEPSALDDALSVVVEYGQGMIGFNTTVSRDGVTDPKGKEAGGLSGALLAERSLELHCHISRYLPKDFVRIAVGGVDPTNVREFLKYAHLTQLLTSWVYWGPSVALDCNQLLLWMLKRNRLSSLSQLVILEKMGLFPASGY